MRNWNRSICYSIVISINCEPTYEELKSHRYKPPHFGDSNCEPTYEELKWVVVGVTRISSPIIASLPMRNWNRFYLLYAPALIFNCEPTYEELKFVLLRSSTPAIVYCEPTYEELKYTSFSVGMFDMVRIASLPMRNWNKDGHWTLPARPIHCEPTYEELKYNSKSFYFLVMRNIASLPMRNWNPRRTSSPM